MRKILFASLTLIAVSAPALAGAPSTGPSLQDRQQAACYGDVQRLCGDALPDVAKAAACMKDKRPLVSKQCSDMWDVKN